MLSFRLASIDYFFSFPIWNFKQIIIFFYLFCSFHFISILFNFFFPLLPHFNFSVHRRGPAHTGTIKGDLPIFIHFFSSLVQLLLIVIIIVVVVFVSASAWTRCDNVLLAICSPVDSMVAWMALAETNCVSPQKKWMNKSEAAPYGFYFILLFVS